MEGEQTFRINQICISQMGIIKGEQVFAGILTFLVSLRSKWKYFHTERKKVKIPATHKTLITIQILFY